MSNIIYQWQVSVDGGETYSDVPHSGTILELNNLNESYHGYFYRCRMNRNNSRKYRYSQPAKLSVIPDIIISKLPDSANISNGQLDLTATVVSTAGSITTYQWQYSDDNKNYYNIANATGASLSINNLTHNDNGKQYRLCANSYFVSGFSATECTNSTTVFTQPFNNYVHILKQPQNYYGSGSPSFSVEVTNTNNADTDYVWQASLDNGQTWQTISNTQTLYVNNRSLDKFYNLYRVQISQSGHTLISDTAQLLPYMSLPDQSSRPSEVLGLNTFIFKSINSNLGTLSNNFGTSTIKWPQEIILLSIKDKQKNKQYTITANMMPSRTFNRKPLAINDILFYQNKTLVATANNNGYTEFIKSDPLIRYESDEITINSSRATAAVVGKNYGRGYCINFSVPILRLGHTDVGSTYTQIVANAIAKCSQVKFGTIKVAIFSSGNITRDTQMVNTLPKKIFVKNGIVSNANIQYTILTYSNITDMSAVLSNYDVLIIDNPYNSLSRASYFNTSRQNDILNFVRNGGGLITGEWTLYRAARGSFANLKDAFPVIPNRSLRRIRSPFRWYVFDSFNEDAIMSNNIENIDFTYSSIVRHEGIFSKIKSGSDIFYMSEQYHNRNLISTKKMMFSMITTFPTSGSDTKPDSMFRLEAQQKYNRYVAYGNKYYECWFHFGKKIHQDIEIGGLLYWAYKSLIEHYREGANTRLSPWRSSSVLNGTAIDGFGAILKTYNKNITDFIYNENNLNDTETVTQNDSFWRDLSRLLSGRRPIGLASINQTEIPLDNYIKIVNQPSVLVDTNNNNRSIDIKAHSLLNTPILYELEYSRDGLNFVNYAISNTMPILMSGLNNNELNSSYRLKLSSPQADTVYSNIFRLDRQTINLNNSWSPDLLAPLLSNNTVFAEADLVVGWQYSFDNKNYYDILTPTGLSGNYNTLSLNLNDYNNSYIRYQYLHNETTGFSLSQQITDINHDIFMKIEHINTRFVSGIKYIDAVAYIDRYNNAIPISENTIIWQKYSINNIDYENITGMSGNSVLYISGMPANLIDQYKFRAIVQNKVIYP